MASIGTHVANATINTRQPASVFGKKRLLRIVEYHIISSAGTAPAQDMVLEIVLRLAGIFRRLLLVGRRKKDGREGLKG